MKLSRSQKKLWHSALIGFATGALTTLQIAVTSGLTERKAIIAAAVGAVAAGLARAIGAVLAWIETTDPKPPAEPPAPAESELLL